MWITIPNNGYKCYSNKFNGCWASKVVTRSVYYTKIRNNICNQNINPILTITKTTSNIDIKMDSMFNQCSVNNGVINCYADASFSFNGIIKASNTESMKFTTNGRIDFNLKLGSDNKPKVVSNSVKYV
jgi:hypothetical protein